MNFSLLLISYIQHRENYIRREVVPMHAMKAEKEHIWRRVVSFTRRSPYHRKNRRQYALQMTLGKPPSRSGHFGENKIYCPCREPNLDSLASCIPSAMSRLFTFN